MDDEYIDKVLSGGSNSFRYFLKTYKDMAFNIAVSIVKDDHYAEEIVQDSFMKAFNNLKSFNRTAKFKSWFYRNIVNESFQALRKLKKGGPVVDISELAESSLELPIAPSNEITEKVIQLIRLLPPKESLVLNLFYLEDYSLKEVGEMTGWTISNAKVILHRARKNLRTQIKNNS